MKQIIVSKLYKGKYVSVGDWHVRDAIKRNQNLKINFKGEYMVLSPAQLPKGILNPTVFFSAFNSQSYRLIDFVWKPDADQMEFESVEKESNKPKTSFSYF
jgi:hypothetical protein